MPRPAVGLIRQSPKQRSTIGRRVLFVCAGYRVDLVLTKRDLLITNALCLRWVKVLVQNVTVAVVAVLLRWRETFFPPLFTSSQLSQRWVP